MTYIKSFIILVILFSSVGCTVYKKFDTLYYNQEYINAYDYLKTDGNSSSLLYQERELKVLLHLAMSDTPAYLPLLDEVLLKPIPETMTNWHYLARSWIRFLSAETKKDYENILAIVPRLPFKEENKAEQLRLTIQNHSLIRLNKDQEALAYLNASTLTETASDLLYIKGLALLNLEQYQAAQENFLQLITISTNNKLKSLAYFYLGNIAMQEKKSQQAEQYYLEAWALNPYQAELNFQLGKVLQKKSYSDLHYRFYRASLRLNENLAEAWYYLNI